QGTANPFQDVKAKNWFYNAVLWAVEKVITTGKDATHFAPNDTCTRAEVVTFLYAAFQQPEVQTTENPFQDVKAKNWFYNAVLWAVENNITTGKDATHFAPNDTCTRAEIVTFLYAAFAEHYNGFVSRLVNGKYVRAEDEEIYNANFSEFAALMEQSRNAATMEERFALEAQAEAALLDTATMIPNTTRGGAYAMSRVAPHTTPDVKWGSDSKRLHSLVVSDEFLTTAEREELQAMWKLAVAGEGSYDPAAYLTGKGHTLKDTYDTNYNMDPVTLDWLNTCSSGDTQFLCQCVDGLVEYDELMNLQPKLAESWEVSDDGMTYTFHIRHDAKWYTYEGEEYAPVTARDFVCGFHHMLDCRAGLEGLVGAGGAEIHGVGDYMWSDGSFDEVGCKATDDYTLVFTLDKPVPFFRSMLTYSIFLPICESFYEAQGGVYGLEEYANRDIDTYKFGLNTDASSQVYCGPFLLQGLTPYHSVICRKNANYYDADKVTLDWIRWSYNSGEDPDAFYNDTVNGVYDSVTLNDYLLDVARSDGNFDKYAYVTETESVTYMGGLNLNRGTFALENGNCASPKAEQRKADTATALNNKAFRKAMMHAFDKRAHNAASRGDELAETSLRNMINHPELVKLENDYTDANGHTFPAGTLYGEMVQYYCDQIGCKVNCQDGVDGWFNPTAAQEYLADAKEELKDAVSWPIQIDVVYYSAFDTQVAQANCYKSSIEDTLGKENVIVNLIAATTPEDYYACGYRAMNGEAINNDMFYGFGWAPDFGDPCSCLNTFNFAVDGYQLKYLGLF
ncbi:MAG: S-layer homology domain-containing protein, partial [Victivallales bacterium]|nr:S-layer homology domain-containing protein [Victivallales bacterium]